jgi:hypothetical protein
MNIKSSSLALLCSFSFLACGKQQEALKAVVSAKPNLPEAYGFYLRSEKELVRFDTDQDLQSQYNRAGKTSILIFDRRLTTPGLKLSEAAKLLRVVPVRYDVTLVHEEPSGPVVDHVLERVDQYVVIDPVIPCAIKPVEGKADMVEFVPELGKEAIGLEPGVYGFRFLDDNLLLFGVRLSLETGTENEVSAAAMLQRPEAWPHDRFAKVVMKQPGGYWSQFRGNMDHSTSGGSFRQGKPVEKEWLAPVKELDGLETTWRGEVRRWCGEQEFLKAQTVVDRLRIFRPGDMTAQEELDQSLLNYAQSQLKENPLVAVALAHRIRKGSKHYPDAQTLFQQGLADAKIAHSLEVAEKEKWNASIQSWGELIQSFDYVSERSFFGDVNRTGKIFIHAKNLKYLQRADKPEDVSWWHLGLVGDIQSYEEKVPETFSQKATAYPCVRVNHVGYLEPLRFEFAKQSQRDAFFTALKEAKADFDQRHEPARHWTLSHVEPSFDPETSQICYTVTLNDSFLSPPIFIHPLTKSWGFDDSTSRQNYGVWVDGQKQQTAIGARPTVKTGQKLQFALSHSHQGGDWPKIKVLFEFR